MSAAHVRSFSRASGVLARTDPIDARLIARSIPGIGPVPTANLIGDLPGMGHCSDKQIAALVASNHNPVRHIFAERLKEKGKPHKVVLIVVARKLLIIANTLIAKDTVWEPS